MLPISSASVLALNFIKEVKERESNVIKEKLMVFFFFGGCIFLVFLFSFKNFAPFVSLCDVLITFSTLFFFALLCELFFWSMIISQK